MLETIFVIDDMHGVDIIDNSEVLKLNDGKFNSLALFINPDKGFNELT